MADLNGVIGNFADSEYQRQFRPTGRQRPRDQAGLLILGASHVALRQRYSLPTPPQPF